MFPVGDQHLLLDVDALTSTSHRRCSARRRSSCRDAARRRSPCLAIRKMADTRPLVAQADAVCDAGIAVLDERVGKAPHDASRKLEPGFISCLVDLINGATAEPALLRARRVRPAENSCAICWRNRPNGPIRSVSKPTRLPGRKSRSPHSRNNGLVRSPDESSRVSHSPSRMLVSCSSAHTSFSVLPASGASRMLWSAQSRMPHGHRGPGSLVARSLHAERIQSVDRDAPAAASMRGDDLGDLVDPRLRLFVDAAAGAKDVKPTRRTRLVSRPADRCPQS
jgi:hypothetical protein